MESSQVVTTTARLLSKKYDALFLLLFGLPILLSFLVTEEELKHMPSLCLFHNLTGQECLS